MGTPSHLGHMDRVAATIPSQAHAGAAQEAPNIGQWEEQDVPLVRPSSWIVKAGIPSSRRYLPTYVPEDSDTAMQAPEWASFLSIVDGSLNPVPLCDLDQVLLKEVMAENRGLTLFDLKNRSPEHLSATLTGCESPDDYLESAAVKEDADDQLSEIASTIPPGDPSCVDLKHSAFLAQLLLEEVDLESTYEPASPLGSHCYKCSPSTQVNPWPGVLMLWRGLLQITCHCLSMTLRNSGGCCT